MIYAPVENRDEDGNRIRVNYTTDYVAGGTDVLYEVRLFDSIEPTNSKANKLNAVC